MKKYILFPILMLLVFTACSHKNNDNSASTTAETQLTEDNKETDPFVGEYYSVIPSKKFNEINYNGKITLRIQKDKNVYKVTDLLNNKELDYKLEDGELIHHLDNSRPLRISFLKDRNNILFSTFDYASSYYTNVKNRDKFKIYKP
ncbi:hypothetical protein ACQ1Q5_00325 [Ornithobacterium rhinotracheale]